MDCKTATQARYTEEAARSNDLSCGGALDLAQIRNDEIVVDLGCGRGKDVVAASHQARFVFGIDFTEKMIEVAREAISNASVENAQCLTGSLELIPLADATVDVVISNCAINHAPEKDLVFAEIYRVLTRGGRFVVSDIIAERKLAKEISQDPAAVSACYGGAITWEEYLGAVTRAGFDPVETLEKSSPYVKSGVMLQKITLRGHKK